MRRPIPAGGTTRGRGACANPPGANALAPTMIDTPMIDGQRELVSRIPVGRLGKPEEVAALICFLASEHAGYITGEITDINGGFFVD